ncbi:MAG: hypothetical protein WCH40_04100 [Verrucomicrobiales bacterium]
MPQSVCIEQIEGYIRNRGDRASFTIDDNGDAIEIRVPMNRLVTLEGNKISPIRITVSDARCGIVLTMPEVYHPATYATVNVFPKKIGHQSSGLRPLPYTVAGEYDRESRRLDLKMVVPAVGPSVTQTEFHEAVAAFIQIADRWAARIQRPPAQQCDDHGDGAASGRVNGLAGGGPEDE